MIEAIRLRLEPTSQTARLDAQVLLAHVLHKPRSWVMAHPEYELDNQQLDRLGELLTRLEAGEPLPYVIGQWEFFNLEFLLTPAVLIPRPETELLVEKSLAWLAANPERRWVLDAGTGSGCIAISLAKSNAGVTILACDLSFEALKVARRNVQKHEIFDRIHFVLSDLIPATARRFDLMCANLPYIPRELLSNLQAARNEPIMALDGGESGTGWIEKFLQLAPASLASGGLILLEIEASQGLRVADMAQSAFPTSSINIIPDMAGNDRLISIQST